jgi:DNA-directed RNA polymerase subunit RPC12/RpoP
MTTTELACNHCGAPLDVPNAVNFATCAYCGSKLSVHRNATAAWTEVSERIAADTSRIGEGVTLLTLQAEVQRLDREWQMRAGSATGSRRSHKDDDEHDNGPLGALIGLLVPLFAIYMIFGKGETGPTLVLLVILAVAAVVALRTGALTRLFGPHLTESEYQRRRGELVHRIEELGGTL